jgi:hypothetical protein
MKMLHKSIVLIVLFCSSTLLYAQQTCEKTLVKSFDVLGKTEMVLDFGNSHVKIVEWDSNTARVEMTIAFEGNENTLKSLITVGRYNMVSNVNGNVFTIGIPGLQRSVKIKGTEVKEVISYQVSVPKGAIVKIKDAALGAL